jgi:nicotinate-nucleotide pyrophosphorylase (carboxylating)
MKKNIKENITKIIKNALDEDIGGGDITTAATVSDDVNAIGKFLVKQNGIIAGFEIVEECFSLIDPDIKFKKYHNDGDAVKAGTVAAEVEGKASSILIVERTALNFFQRMSGIATSLNLFSEKIKHTNAKIIDTRKTVPGLREIDKLAVKLAGGTNHRIGLYDMFLIKDNHITAAGSIKAAIEKCKKFREKSPENFKIEVETKNLEDVNEALSSGVDVIMLDNFKFEEMKKAVELINGKCKVEASGMVNLETVKAIAETGVDFISVGAITHSVKALDISLKISVKN